MLNLFKRFKKDAIWDFDGGIHPPEMKTQSNGTPLRHLPLPDRFILPLKQHIGSEGEICVRPGDRVLRGQPLTFGNARMLPVHAPTSGTVSHIGPHMTAHPSALAEMCITILPDGEDRWCEKTTVSDYRQLERSELVARVHQAGVAGLGGAGFPTATKLRGGLRGVNTLIINAAECEPYITADDRLMQDCAAEVLEGSRILAWILQAERVLIGIEDNKPEAIAALKTALGTADDLQIRVIPTKYPSGGAKQLTRILTGKEVPHGGRSTDIGVLMQNVGTAYAVKRAVIDGEPLTERVVTLTGEAVRRPGNVWARLGTPISHLLKLAEFVPGNEQMVVMGGPLMGFTLPSLDVPVVKITNCILAPSASEMGPAEPEKGCIRCSACADACPAGLLPQQLYWYSRGGDHDKAREHNIADCIECGACAYVCPSNIPLVQYYRQEKAEIQAIDLEAERNAQAKARFEARQQRLEREKQARDAKHQQAKRSAAASDPEALNAARERVKARQLQTEAPETQAVDRANDEAARAALRESRLAEAKARQAAKRTEAASAEPDAPLIPVREATPAAAEDPRKAAVAAAIARAKAKKAAQAAGSDAAQAETAAEAAPVTAAPQDTAAAAAEDPRKAAVAAAIARAKAKKAAQAAGSDDAQADSTADAAAVTPATAAPQNIAQAAAEDPRKAAVAAAIARAKAKKAAQAAGSAEAQADSAADAAAVTPAAAAPQDTAPAAAEDPRKAAIAAAIARAKAKKAAQAAESDDAQADSTADAATVTPAAATPQDTAPAAAEDPRKAAIAAAIARAKAKKAAQAAGSDDTQTLTHPEPEAVTSDDARKAAVAAAIARVKARKAQQPSTQED